MNSYDIIANEIDELIGTHFEYTTDDLEHIILCLVQNHLLTTKGSIGDLIDSLEKLKEVF